MIAGYLKIGLDVLEKWEKIAKERRQAVCDDLHAMADLLQEMQKSFENEKVPREQGHEFEVLLHAPSKTLLELQEESLAVRDLIQNMMADLYREIEEMDAEFDRFKSGQAGHWEDEVLASSKDGRKRHFEAFIENLQRARGQLRGYARILRPGR